jgi:hypothetical protein
MICSVWRRWEVGWAARCLSEGTSPKAESETIAQRCVFMDARLVFPVLERELQVTALERVLVLSPAREVPVQVPWK